MKYHISSIDIRWGFCFMEFCQSVFSFLQNANSQWWKKGPAGLGSCWEGEGGCGLSSVDNHDLV